MPQLIATLPAMGASAGAAGGASAMSSLAMMGQAAGTGISAFAQFRAAKDIRNAGKAQMIVHGMRADQAQQEGRERTLRIREESRHALAATRARMAAGGVAGTGSSLTALGEQARRLELRASDEARRAAMDAANERWEGGMKNWQAKKKSSATKLRGFGTLLEGVSSHAKKGKDLGVYNFNRT